MRAFPFTIHGAARDQCYYLSLRIPIWEAMERLFIKKYFPTSRVAAIGREICGIEQQDRETLSEYWEKFNKLSASYPQHQIQEHSPVQWHVSGFKHSKLSNQIQPHHHLLPFSETETLTMFTIINIHVVATCKSIHYSSLVGAP